MSADQWVMVCVLVVAGCTGGVVATESATDSTSSEGATSTESSSSESTGVMTSAATTEDGTTEGASTETAGEELLPKELTVLATGYPGSRPVLLHDGDVIWGAKGGEASGSGRLLRVAVAGGVVETLLSALDTPNDLVVLKGSLFYADVKAGRVGSLRLDTLEASVVADGYALVTAVDGDDTSLYWISAGTEGRFARWMLRGGGVVDLVTGLDNAQSMKVLSDSVLWLESGQTREIRAWPKGGGPATTFAAVAESSRSLAVDEAYVYWASAAPGGVFRAPIGGGATETVAEGLLAPRGVTLDDARVYWVDAPAGTVSYRSKSLDGPHAALVSGLKRPEHLALSSTHVFMTDFDAGEVLRVGKPDQ